LAAAFITQSINTKWRLSTQLVYYELYLDSENAIKREKQIKNLVRRKKIAMITTFNFIWRDLYPDIL
ncbi:MAG: GIY-YIG nuclease family protein, partial [Patescibacteria group bacterium]